MALPKRVYIVRVGAKQIMVEKLKDAFARIRFRDGQRFSYRVYDGGNSVECEWLAGGKFRERRK